MSLPPMGPIADHALAFVLTYLIHSTVLIGAAFAFVRVVKPRSNPLCEALWTVALFGGLVSTSLEMAAGVGSRAPTIALRRTVEPVVVDLRESAVRLAPAKHLDSAAAKGGSAKSRDAAPPKDSKNRTSSNESSLNTIPVSSEPRSTPEVAPRSSPALRTLRSLAPLAIALGMLAGALWLLALVVRSRSALRERVRVLDGALFERLESLRERLRIPFAVTLSISNRIASPVAFGFKRREICVPSRALEKLDAGQQEAMLAHELAHLVRRDPLRLVVARALESVLFFQPLNRLARRRLFDVIEQRCDAFAVERLGAGLALAGCLAEVASWIHDAPHRSLAPAMAEFGSSLGRRIEGLLDEDRTLERERRQRGFAPLVFLVLPFVAAAAPAVAVQSRAANTFDENAKALREEATRATQHGPIANEDGISALGDEISELVDVIDGMRSELDAKGVSDFQPRLENFDSRLKRIEQIRTEIAEKLRTRASRPAEAHDATATEFNTDRSNSRRNP